MTSAPPPNYWDYLRLDRLLSSQGGLEDDESRLLPDELHFIVVHQAFELWFKLVLSEMRHARDQMSQEPVPEEAIPHVVHHLGRVNEIMSLAVDQFRIMETLTPQDFLAFRDKLVPASGFQSVQMRELEILMGLDDEQRVSVSGLDAHAPIRAEAARSEAGRIAFERLQKARAQESLRDALHRWLFRAPIRGSSPDDPGDEAVVDAFLTDYVAAFERHHRPTDAATKMAAALGEAESVIGERFEQSLAVARRFLFAEDAPEPERARMRRIRAALVFIESYRDLPLLAWPRLLVDTVVELEEQMVLFRTRHARMVERTIGRRVGTGGSSGVDYLDRTTRYRTFPELWAVRTVLLPKAVLPPLANPEAYGFAR